MFFFFLCELIDLPENLGYHEADIGLFEGGLFDEEVVNEFDAFGFDFSKEIILDEIEKNVMDFLLLKILRDLFSLGLRRPLSEFLV